MLDAVRMENSKSISKTEYNRRIVILDSIPKTLTTLAPTTHCSFNDFLLLRFQIFNCIPIFACLVISSLQFLPTSFSLSLSFSAAAPFVNWFYSLSSFLHVLSSNSFSFSLHCFFTFWAPPVMSREPNSCFSFKTRPASVEYRYLNEWRSSLQWKSARRRSQVVEANEMASLDVVKR